MNNPVIFYHLWPVGEWERINEEIFKEIVDSGLSKRMSEINICVNTDIDFKEINLHGIPEDKVQFHRIPNTQSEWPTLDILYSKYINIPDTPILYIHCKGARFTAKDSIYDAVNSWTRGMSYFNINRWKKCYTLLSQGRPSVGIRVERLPVPHYSGNFWWVNSSYLRYLLNPKTQIQTFQNRHGAEFWIGRLGLNYLFDVNLKRSHFTYGTVIDRSEYEVNTSSSKGICVHVIDSTNISWLDSVGIDYEVYSKGNGLLFNSSVACYFTYIINNYDNLPEYVYFIKSNSNRTIPNLDIIFKNNYIKFNAFGTFKTNDSNKGLPNHPGLDIESLWNSYLVEPCPDNFDFIAGSTFGVSSKEIKKYPVELYERILANIEKKDSPIEDFCFERMWGSFFTLKKVLKESPGSGDSFSLSSKIDRVASNGSKMISLFENEIDVNNVIGQLDEISKKMDIVIYTKGNVDYSEFNNFVDNVIPKRTSEYTEHSFDKWKCFVLNTEYYTKNITKKKKIIQPLEQHIKEFML